MVRVDLSEAVEGIAVRVERSDQRDSWSYRLGVDRSRPALRRPHLTLEVGLVEPRLVDVQDPEDLTEQLQHLEAVLLAHR